MTNILDIYKDCHLELDLVAESKTLKSYNKSSRMRLFKRILPITPDLGINLKIIFSRVYFTL